MSEKNEIRIAVSVAMTRGERFLLVKRGRPPAKGLYAFPGGRVECGETLEAAARRELAEETGLCAGELVLHSVLDLKSADTGITYRLHVHRAEHAGGEAVAGDDAAEAGWFTVAQMADMPVTASTLAVAREIMGALKGLRE